MADFLAADPARAEVLLIHGPSAGRAVFEIRAETVRQFSDLLAATVATLAPCAPEAPDRSAIVIESLAGGLYHVAYVRTLRGEVRELPALVPEMARMVVGAYLGVGGA